MAQASQFFSFSAANIATVDLGIIDECLDALFSNNSGAGPPPNSGGIPGMSWYDSDLPVADGGLLKHANSTSSAWYGIFSGSSSFKIWAYLANLTTEEGWVRDSSAKDVVLSLKSDIGAYAVSGEVAPLSSWEISGLTVAAHAAHTHSMQSHTHSHTHGSGSDLAADGYAKSESATATSDGPSVSSTGDPSITLSHSAPVSDSTWRIRAAVGIMVYCDV